MSDALDPQRRDFLKTAGAAAATALTSNFFVHASDKAGAKPAVIGSGEFTYECHHNWGEVPDHIQWHATHGVAVDAAGLVYITHRAPFNSDIDTAAVFEPTGKFVRSFGKQWNFGGHGIDIRKDGNEEFLYLAITTTKPPDGSKPRPGLVTKTTLKGEKVWELPFPKESNLYDAPEKYSPTNIAFAPDGGFYVADGYGSNYIHQYDKDAKYVRSFGGTGDEPGKFKTPHGIWLDNRPGRDPLLIVADRANARLQYFTLDGKPVSIVGNVSFPAHFDIQGTKLLDSRSARPRLDLRQGQQRRRASRLRSEMDRTGARRLQDARTARALGERQVHPSARRLLRSAGEHLRRRMGRHRPRVVPERRWGDWERVAGPACRVYRYRHSRAGGNPARRKTALHHQVRKPPRMSFFATTFPSPWIPACAGMTAPSPRIPAFAAKTLRRCQSLSKSAFRRKASKPTRRIYVQRRFKATRSGGPHLHKALQHFRRRRPVVAGGH